MIYTTVLYRKRIDNIEYASRAVKSCFRKLHIRDYIPGQAIYNLGEYPNKMTIRPTEYDYNRIKQLAENGVGLIQIHEEWNDALRVMGADKYSSHDKEGLKEFIKLCHSFGIKILPYLSSGFFDERDPDYNPKFVAHPDAKLYQNYYRYRLGNAGSPEWNKFLFDNVRRVLDEYEFDGIFNDMGYDGFDNKGNPYAYGEYDPFIEDLLVRLYTVVKNDYHGIVKLHIGKTQFPVTDEKIYDYLWVGESCKTSEELMETVKCSPFVVPCPDYKFTDETNGDIYFARALPFLQFPLRLDGRPITGERSCAPDIEYLEDAESLHFRKMREYYQKHPNGPYVYSEWSQIPDDESLREKWFEYLKLYKPMVREDSMCFVDINENNGITAAPLAEDVHMSLFVNEECYLCLSNLGKTGVNAVFKELWKDRVSGERVKEKEIPAGGMLFLQRL